MKQTLLLTLLLFSFIECIHAQAETALNKGGCASKKMRYRYSSKAQIAGSGADGKIVAATNLLLTRQENTAFTFIMEAGEQYNINLIFDSDIKNKMSPHQEAWGNAYINGKLWRKLSKQSGSDIFYDIPVADTRQEVEIKMMGSNYYDLRDAEMPEDACAIIYAVKRKTNAPPTTTEVIKKTDEPTTFVPEKKPETRNTIFSNWEEAKTKLNWLWLEVPATDKNVRRYFSNNSLMVLQKNSGHSWTQAFLSYKPFPAYWNYEATFNFVKGRADDAVTGLMLPGTKNGEEVKMMFWVNPLNQTWFFGYYNVVSQKWFSFVPGATTPISSAFINKYDSAYNYVANKLSMYREGKKIMLYINNKLVQTIEVSGNVTLNKINGIGITGRGEQGYYVTNPLFWVLE